MKCQLKKSNLSYSERVLRLPVENADNAEKQHIQLLMQLFAVTIFIPKNSVKFKMIQYRFWYWRSLSLSENLDYYI